MSLTLHTILEGLIVGSLCLSLRFPEADPDTRFQVQVVCSWGFPGGAGGKELACGCRRYNRLGSLGGEDPLEKCMATHSRILVWRIPWTEEPTGFQSIGSQRVGHD